MNGECIGLRRLVTMSGVRKQFGAVIANDNVDLEIRAGEVLALLGENGAGKSTLMKVLYGFYHADAGEIRIDGTPISFASPREAMASGIGMVFQQFSLVPALSVLENLLAAFPEAPWLQRRGSARVNAALRWLRPARAEPRSGTTRARARGRRAPARRARQGAQSRSLASSSSTSRHRC